MKKLIAIDTRPLLEARRGGVATYAAELTDALAARGDHRLVLFCNAWKGRLPAGIPAAGTDVVPCETHWPNRLLNVGFRLGWPRLEDLTGPFDALWLPNLNFIATRRPYAVTVHDLSFRHMPRFFTPKQRAWHAVIGTDKLLRGAAAVIAVSAHTADDVSEYYGLDRSKIRVVPPAAGSRYRPVAADAVESVRRRHGLRNPYFLFLAALEPRKNVVGLIEAYDRCQVDADLVIAGGRGWMAEPIFRRAAASPKRDRIRFLGYVPEDQKPALYAGAIAFVYPSFYEGFGMPPLEAMACGTPVVTSRAASLGEVVRDAGLLADPFDHSEIARAMEEIAQDQALRAQLTRRGLEIAAGYSWESSAAKLSAVLADIA